MSQPNLNDNRSKRPPHLWAALIIGSALIAIYGWVYFQEPFTNISDYVNDKVGDVLVLIPALVTAVLSTLLVRQFKPAEPPYRIWLAFSLGWWAWLTGELLGFIYDAIYWETGYPDVTVIDLAWVLGYFFFLLSLFYQFHLIYRSRRLSPTIYLGGVALALLMTYGLMRWALAAGLGEDVSLSGLYLAVIYPVLDVFAGGAALWLFLLFGRGYMGRLWWGLIAFAVADSIDSFAWMGGFDRMTDAAYRYVDLFSAVTYIAGYVIAALAAYAAIDHIHRGLRSASSSEEKRD